MNNSDKCKKYYKKKINGNTKQKQIKDQIQQAQKLREDGMTWKEVASAMGISERTAKRLGERLKKCEH